MNEWAQPSAGERPSGWLPFVGNSQSAWSGTRAAREFNRRIMVPECRRLRTKACTAHGANHLAQTNTGLRASRIGTNRVLNCPPCCEARTMICSVWRVWPASFVWPSSAAPSSDRASHPLTLTYDSPRYDRTEQRRPAHPHSHVARPRLCSDAPVFTQHRHRVPARLARSLHPASDGWQCVLSPTLPPWYWKRPVTLAFLFIRQKCL